MTTNTRMLGAVLAVLVLTAGVAGAARPVGTTAGMTYGEWSAEWWQWMASIPAAENPQTSDGSIDCSRGQQGPVWFLAGAPPGFTVERSCTIPRGKSLFFPILSGVFINEAGQDYTVEEKRQQMDGLFNDTDAGPLADFGFPGSRGCGLRAELDGQPIPFFVPNARTQSPPFLLDTGDGPNFLPPGVVDPEAIADGWWVMLPPLAPGEHTLAFGASICELDSAADHPVFSPLDVTYHLTVDGAGGAADPPGPDGGKKASNTEIILSLYQAFAVGDLDTILAIIHPDVVWVESEGIPYGGTFYGRDAVFEGVFGKIAAEWDGFTATSEEVFEADGNRVIVLGRDSGTYKATGKSMVAPAASIWTLNNQGQVVRFVQYIDTRAVHEATLP